MSDSIFQSCAQALGLPVDEFKILLVFISAYPISYGYSCLVRQRHVPPSLRFLFMGLLGHANLYFLFGTEVLLHLYFTSTIVYGLLWLLARFNWPWLKASMSPIVFTLTLLHTSLIHYRRYASNFKLLLDSSTTLMLMCIKLTSFTHDALAGLSSSAPVSSSKEKQEIQEKSHDHPNSLYHMEVIRPLTQGLPPLLEYYSFVFFFQGISTGPLCYFNEYKSFLVAPQPVTTEKRSWFKWTLSEQYAVGLEKCTQGLACMAGWFVLHKHFCVNLYFTPLVFNQPFHVRVVYMMISNFVARLKFYTVWYYVQGSMCIMGLGYRAKMPKSEQWNRLDNVTPSKIELSPEHRSIINNWNKTVQSWLHADVFMPIHAQYGSTLASIATYTISAFWHGMFPGYYFAFLSGALMTIAEKRIWRKHKALLSRPDAFIQGCRILVIQLLYAYCIPPFLILDLTKCLQYWHSLYYFGHMMIAAMIFLV